MKKIIIVLVLFLIYSCKEQSKIEISNTLVLALGDNYSSYTTNLNKAYEKDQIAMSKMLEVDNIYDAAGYDHGYVLYLLMERYSDKEFATVLNKLTKKDLNNAIQYLEVGLDANDKKREKIKQDYPIFSNILKIK